MTTKATSTGTAVQSPAAGKLASAHESMGTTTFELGDTAGSTKSGVDTALGGLGGGTRVSSATEASTGAGRDAQASYRRNRGGDGEKLVCR